ncbi:hypothetical protein FEM21_05530 [Flavobacterium seoulense]|uniref:Uncharacterized protein n=1 Tax=Flavobacterium seoulense TaxID=1492738 RepID=A0A066WZN6_9FLAO|nr:hypothetical protein FEM21_05530 [Flavobacterium seoulense]
MNFTIKSISNCLTVGDFFQTAFYQIQLFFKKGQNKPLALLNKRQQTR